MRATDMTILQANLKHFYQRTGFWVIDLILGAGIVLGAMLAGTEKLHPVLLFPCFMYLAGMFVGAMQVEVLCKPFAYCLPGHERIPARLLFGVGLGSALLWSVAAMLYPAGDRGEAIVMGISVFFASTLFYWLMVWTVFRFQNWAGAIGLVVLVMVFGGYFGMEGVLRRVLLEGWLFVIAAGCVVNIAAWRFLTRSGLARRYCGRLWLGALDPWNKERMTRFSQARMAQKKSFRVLPRVEQFFLRRISRESDVVRYIWGNLYRSGLGLAASRRREWIFMALVWLGIACIMGYMEPAANILFVMPGLMVMQMRLGVHSSLLTAGGRRQRFWSALVLALSTAVFVTGAVTLIAGMSVLLQPLMPELTFGGQSVVYHAMDMRLFVIPLAMIPVTLTFALVFYRHPRLAFGAVILVFVLCFQIPLMSRIVPDLTVDRTVAAAAPAAIIVGCWAMFTAVLRYICMRRCLVH